MATMLKSEKKWDQPDVPLKDVPVAMKLVVDLSKVTPLCSEKIDAVMKNELQSECNDQSASTASTEEITDASVISSYLYC